MLPPALGIVLSIAVLIAMSGVANRKSLNALARLSVILWFDVINELVATPLAMYWTRAVHVSYLASLQRS